MEPDLKWYCIRSQPKHEHLAAGHLKADAGVEVFLPRIRFRRSTRKGPVWFTEALFPNYLFARFELRSMLRQVHHTSGVAGIIHFGDQFPSISDIAIAELQSAVGTEDVKVIPPEFEQGDSVLISGGSFHGLTAVVTRVMPSRERVAVLLEFLGRETSVEVPVSSLLHNRDVRSDVA